MPWSVSPELLTSLSSCFPKVPTSDSRHPLPGPSSCPAWSGTREARTRPKVAADQTGHGPATVTQLRWAEPQAQGLSQPLRPSPHNGPQGPSTLPPTNPCCSGNLSFRLRSLSCSSGFPCWAPGGTTQPAAPPHPPLAAPDPVAQKALPPLLGSEVPFFFPTLVPCPTSGGQLTAPATPGALLPEASSAHTPSEGRPGARHTIQRKQAGHWAGGQHSTRPGQLAEAEPDTVSVSGLGKAPGEGGEEADGRETSWLVVQSLSHP